MARILSLIGYVCLWLSAAVCLPAEARWQPQYAAQPPHVQQWFKQQHNARGEWCCDEADGHEYDGDYALAQDGSVVLPPLQGESEKHVIPADKVLRGPNPTGHAVWWYRDTSSGRRDYCFAPGAGT